MSAMASLTRYRHGKRCTSKRIANEGLTVGWRGSTWGDIPASGAGEGTVTIRVGTEVNESYCMEINGDALREAVRMYNAHQTPENKI